MNLGNVAGGHKAAIAKPRVSEEAKQHAKEVLKETGSRGELPEQQYHDDEGKNPGNNVGGHNEGPQRFEGSKEAF